MLNILTKYSLIAILLMLLSCTKEDEYVKYQINVTAKDIITIKYYNGIDTLIRKQLYHFSTFFVIYNDNVLPYIHISGKIKTVNIYKNSINITSLYNVFAINLTYDYTHRFGVSRYNRDVKYKYKV